MSASSAERRLAKARHWLAIADRDLRVAMFCLSPAEPETGVAAYHTQQAAEKMVKALLVVAHIDFPHTHNLGALVDLAAPAWPALRMQLEVCRPLTPWNFEFRYPMPANELEPLPSVDDVQTVLDKLRDFRAAIDAALMERG
jgi:HEPN domain-containing protein